MIDTIVHVTDAALKPMYYNLISQPWWIFGLNGVVPVK